MPSIYQLWQCLTCQHVKAVYDNSRVVVNQSTVYLFSGKSSRLLAVMQWQEQKAGERLEMEVLVACGSVRCSQPPHPPSLAPHPRQAPVNKCPVQVLIQAQLDNLPKSDPVVLMLHGMQISLHFLKCCMVHIEQPQLSQLCQCCM